ncbi:hypothetical protein [Bradyrhizobium erythrophlei]|uniref:Sulfite dehydrogenase (Cytochrome) subunit SorB n=1 Tax=Bradyrhizobium erythrophlei TaxID=1437360 RepID=A0A1H4YPJ7_9BRAD|nr:hypothetical protein [Bradyrhizobium erythrophlei]SED18981.1 hypothetical protein SAMN05444164_4010 [Bradyrhizobium erythrophlei]
MAFDTNIEERMRKYERVPKEFVEEAKKVAKKRGPTYQSLSSWPFSLLSATSIPVAARGAAPFELKPGKVDLPDSDKMFPDGPSADAINNNCLACHSADMVLNQPTLSKTAWTAEVLKTINNYKAPVAPEDVGPIVDYLTALKGTK